MAEVNPAAFLQNAGSTHTAEITRQAFAGIINGALASTSLRPRGGVNPHIGNQLRVQQAGSPNMSVDVLNGYALVTGTEGTKQAAYSCLNDGTKNVTIAAADGSNPRIDLIVCRVRDAFYSGVTNAWAIEAVTGTPAGSPVAPATPANAIVLAQIAVGAGVTSIVNANITDTRIYFAGVGGILSVANQAERDALVTSSITSGTAVWRRDSSILDIRDSASNWLGARLGAWVDFSSAALVSAQSGGYVKGSTTYVAQYTQVGKTVTYTGAININTGGGFNPGSGFWNILLPVNAAARMLSACAGSCRINDSGTLIYSGSTYIQAATVMRIDQNQAGGDLGSGGPGTAWATGDSIIFGITYEAA